MTKNSLIPTLILTCAAVLGACSYYETKVPADEEGSINLNPEKAMPDCHVIEARILRPKCGKCHTSSSPHGGIDFSSEESLHAVVDHDMVVPNDPAQSLLWQVIDEGQMPPRRAPQLTSDEKEMIACWIRNGARFDSTSCGNVTAVELEPTPTVKPSDPITKPTVVPTPKPSPTSQPTPVPTVTPTVVPPPTPELTDVAWLKDNLFANSCALCHSGPRAKAGVKLDSVEALLALAGKQLLVPSNAAGSAVVNLIKNQDMPPPSTEEIPSAESLAMLECWINNGANAVSKQCQTPENPPTPEPTGVPTPTARPEPTHTPVPDPEPAPYSYASLRKNVLIPNCIGCHNERKASGDVRLDNIGAILNPTEGPRVVRCGRPENGRLYKVVEDDEMPYESDPISAQEKQIIYEWIKRGCSE
jgi:hypothetical protein